MGRRTPRPGRVRAVPGRWREPGRQVLHQAPAEPGPRAFHRSLPGYAPTPLVDRPDLARELGLARLWVKDESSRFGLQSFKALGASYAVYRLLAARWRERFPGRPLPDPFGPAEAAALGPMTLATATDGNHGRGVAWTARRLGLGAVVYVPAGTAPARIARIRAEGAEVVVADGDYDVAVERCAAEAEAAGRTVVSDTSWPGYETIPAWITEGYLTLFEEVAEALAARREAGPDLVLLQAGVGALAAAGVMYYRRTRPGPAMVTVEPLDADCLVESALHAGGTRRRARGRLGSIMAGLNCGWPSALAWPVLKTGIDLFLAVDDDYARRAMRSLARPGAGGKAVESGESGAAGLAGLLALVGSPILAGERELLGLDSRTRALVISTEGATDPAGYAAVMAGG